MFKSFATALLICAAGLFALVHDISAQTTEFTYQGSLKDGPNPANANYDFEFALFDALNAGNPVGPTLTRSSVAVANGIFSVKLDFGSNYPGANRFLEIHVRPTGAGAFTPLAPRQAVSSVPYSVKSLTADNATNAANATNATNATNAASADTLSAACNGCVTGAKIASGQVVKSVNSLTDNVTLAAGSNITITPTGNTLTIASTSGGVGGSGTPNSIPLWDAGGTTLGTSAITQSASGNVGIGTNAPTEKLTIQTATSNYGFVQTDGTITVGSFVGGSGNGGWYGTKSNHPLYFFTGDSSPQMTLTTEGRVGIGTTTPRNLLEIRSTNPFVGINLVGPNGQDAFVARGDGSALVADELEIGGNVYIGRPIFFPLRKLMVAGRARISSIPLEASIAAVCFNAAGDLLQCGASSLKWKTNVQSYRSGLDVIRRLRPISFNWKEDGRPEIGLGAEDVAKVAPAFAFTNSKGEVEGVKYERLNILLINAVKEQQQIIVSQQHQINLLKNVVCLRNKKAGICRRSQK